MLNKYISDLDELREILVKEDKEYLLLSELPAARAFLQVEGYFMGKQVVWNMCVLTMDEYAVSHKVTDDPQQFIDIQNQNNTYFINIGLNLKQIDLAAIERTIIMVRKYKRLRLGRHQYGARSKTQ